MPAAMRAEESMPLCSEARCGGRLGWGEGVVCGVAPMFLERERAAQRPHATRNKVPARPPCFACSCLVRVTTTGTWGISAACPGGGCRS
eukprot:gene17069-biopygen11354